MPEHNSEQMLTFGESRASPSPALPLPGESIWDSRTFYSKGTKHTDLQLDYSALAVKCERAFHTTSNAILDSTFPDIEKGRQMQCFNKEMETIALEVLNQVRQAEYLQKHGLTEGSFTLCKEELGVMCSKEERKERKKKEKEMLVEILGEEDAAKLRRKWRREKKEEKKKRNNDQGSEA